ncbi:MAG: YcxB family protein [Clostridia bacterium]|nr:YcxB family protein [Clostridia bacterium]
MRNEYIIDWPLLKKWTNERHHSGIRLALYIVWCILLVGSFVFTILSIVANMYTNAFYFILIALFSFYRAFLWNVMIAKQQYKRFAQTYGKNSWVRTISFEENGIVIKEEKTETKYNYSDILEIVEKDEGIYLRLQAKTVIRLYKSKIVDCTWEECKEKIISNNPNIKQ